MLYIKNGDEHQQQRKNELSEYLVRLFRRLGRGIMQADAQKHGQKHQQQVLLDKVPYRQRNAHALPHHVGGHAHNERNGKERDYAAERGERNGKRHIPAGQFGKHIGRTPARAAGN